MGGIFTTFILIIGIFASFALYSTSGLRNESQVFVDKSIPKILQNWDYDAFYENSCQTLKQDLSNPKLKKDMDNLWNCFRTLGQLKKVKSSQFNNISTFITPKDGKVTILTYNIDAEFEKGDALITLTIQKEADKWSIRKIFVNSTPFVQGFQNQKL